MLRFIDVLALHNLEFGNGHIFPSQAGLIHEEFSLNNDRITGYFPFGHIEIAGHQVHIHDIILNAISEYLDGKLLLCCLFDFVVTPSEEEVVDGGGQPAEKDHQDAEEHQVLQDVDC